MVFFGPEDCNHPVDVCRLSRGNVLFVPRTFCPILCGLTHKSGRDVPDVPGLAHKPSSGRFRGIPTTKFLDVFLFVYRFFFSLFSMPNMTGRPGYRTMEMIGGSSAPYLACTPCVPLFCNSFNRGGNRGACRLPGAGGGSLPLCGRAFDRSYSVPIFWRSLYRWVHQDYTHS